nr:SPOR domain-containing protein [uncultured Steroidobacter sp.]
MERPVKERLIGAAVLMAAAVILIPEMLSGPSRDSAEKQAQTADAKGSGEPAIKTYTIDLSQSPGLQPGSVEQTANRAPPPEETPPPETLPAPAPAVAQASPESQVVTPAEPPAQRTPAPVETPKPAPRAETPPPQRAAQPARAEAVPPPKPEPKPESQPRAVASAPSAPRSAVPTGKGWAVQLGSYASEATAARIMNEWRGKGQSAFVMPVTTGGKTLYRVRIGPTKDRASAEAALKVVKSTIPNAAVVAHP